MDIRSSLKIAFIYVASIIGAGFASGREIMNFFTHYYEGGFYGIIVASIIFSFIGCNVLYRVYTQRISKYDEFIVPLMGPKLSTMFEVFTMLFMLSIISVMTAGLSEVFFRFTELPRIIGSLIAVTVCVVFILKDIKWILNLTSVISPIMVAGIMLTGLYIIITRDTSVFMSLGLLKKTVDNWIFSSLLYAGYNVITSAIILCNLLPYIKNVKTGMWGGITGGIVIGAIAMVINIALYLSSSGSVMGELPVIDLVTANSIFFAKTYMMVLSLAMFTSLVTTSFCLTDRLKNIAKIDKKLVCLAMYLVLIPLSLMGFSDLISILYPAFGYIGLFLIITITADTLRVSRGRGC